jgi:uncharacterized protein YjiS (DUF1127 family)
MEQSAAIIERRMRQHAGFALVEFLIELGIAALRAASARIDAAARAHRLQVLRRELHGMSDHMLRDIGVDRAQIDGLFR